MWTKLTELVSTWLPTSSGSGVAGVFDPVVFDPLVFDCGEAISSGDPPLTSVWTKEPPA